MARPELVRRMTDRIRHRGPDDEGAWADDGVVLGHRRLAIVDLSPAGHQPMAHGDYTIVYNGEIYNHAELRKTLPGPFRSTCDTEVLLHLYAEHGARCVERLQGMFAFAIWDRRRKRLFAAVDRMGIKPFFYRAFSGAEPSIAFGSELKALVEIGRPAIDSSALRDFFSYKYIPTPKTIYRDIWKLEPAQTLTWDRHRGVVLDTYWKPESSCEVDQEDIAFARLEELLPEIIQAHTMADVPVGVLLSGGIDSTTITAHLDRPRTFTLAFDIGSHNEASEARETAEHFGTRHVEETATGIDLDEALSAIPDMYDEPYGNHGAWPMHMVSRMAARDVKVVLTGEGGDELFAGYHWYAKCGEAERRDLRNRVLGPLLPGFFWGARSIQRRAASGLDRYAMFLGPFSPKQRQTLLSPDLVDRDYDDLWFFRRYWRPELEPMKRLQWADLHGYLVNDMLVKVDRASMAVSLEARPPLLDHRLVEYALSLSPGLMRRDGKGKVLVRRHLEGRAPSRILTRPKTGFTMPVRRWARQQPTLLQRALRRLEKAGIVRSARRRHFNNEQLWCLLVLDRWLVDTGATL